MTTHVTPAADHVAGPRRPDAARLARAALTRLQDSGTDLAEPADPSLARRD